MGLDPSGEFTLFELMKTAGIRGFQVYEGVSIALSFKQLVGNVAEAVSQRNFTLDSISQIAASIGLGLKSQPVRQSGGLADTPSL